MPTGYTAKLVESGQSFEEFVMTCARAFGALVTMREEPLDAPIPNEFKASTHYVESLEKAIKELGALRRMKQSERIEYGHSAKTAESKRLTKALAEATVEQTRLDEMTAMVNAWKPPTEEHVGLKTFMLEQLETSKSMRDWYLKEIDKLAVKQPVEFYDEAVSSKEWSIKYDKENIVKENERCKGRTEWVRQLRESLKCAT